MAKKSPTAAEPYGYVHYADDGMRSDGKKRYPLDTPDHVRSAWDFINEKHDAQFYNAYQLHHIKTEIMVAARHFGITLDTGGAKAGGKE